MCEQASALIERFEPSLHIRRTTSSMVFRRESADRRDSTTPATKCGTLTLALGHLRRSSATGNKRVEGAAIGSVIRAHGSSFVAKDRSIVGRAAKRGRRPRTGSLERDPVELMALPFSYSR